MAYVDKEVTERFQERAAKRAAKNKPPEVYADVLTISDDGDVLRLAFSASVPEFDDGLGAPTITVARVVISARYFDETARQWIETRARRRDGENA